MSRKGDHHESPAPMQTTLLADRVLVGLACVDCLSVSLEFTFNIFVREFLKGVGELLARSSPTKNSYYHFVFFFNTS